MINEQINTDLFNKIPKNANIAIYGTNPIASAIHKDILLKREDAKISSFIDYYKKEDFEGLEVRSIKKFIDEKKDCDMVILTTPNNSTIENILDVYEIPFITVTNCIIDYYSNKHKILNSETYKEVINIFKDKEDKKLFDIIFKRRLRIVDDKPLAEYYYEKYSKSRTKDRCIKNQYLEKVNKKAIKTIMDFGFNNGFNAIAYNKLLENLEKIYAFEAIYDNCRNSFVEDFILNDKLTIVKAAVGEEKTKEKFLINLSNINASISSFATSIKDKHITDTSHKIIEVDSTTIDDYCSENNIKPDFIKMDIEGAELPALKGGIKTITAHRPQLAISIYHCDSDFVKIPKYLFDNLENYNFKLGHYSPDINETILYAIPNELT